MQKKLNLFFMSMLLVVQLISNGLFIPMTASATDNAPVEQTTLTDEEKAQLAADEADKLEKAQRFIDELFTDDTKTDIKSTVSQPQVTTAESYIETLAEEDQQSLTDTVGLVKAFIAVNALLNTEKTAAAAKVEDTQVGTAKNAVALVDDSFTEGKQVLTERLALVEKSLAKAKVKEQAVVKEDTTEKVEKTETTEKAETKSVKKAAVKTKAVEGKAEAKEITADANLAVTVKKNGTALESNAEVQDGDSISMDVTFDLTSTAIENNSYRNGDYILIKLPVQMLADVKPASGDIKNGTDTLGSYAIQDDYLKITLTDIYDEQNEQEKEVKEGFVNLTATLKSGNDSTPAQSLVFGEENKNNGEIKVPLTFTPKPAQGAKLITKDGQVDPATGKLTWTVIVNGDLSAKKDTNTFTDNLPAQLEYESISVTPITYNLIGVATKGTATLLDVSTDKKTFSYELPDASKAYEFVLVTKNVSTSDAATEKISNTAQITGTVSGEATKTIDVTYGTPLEKTVAGNGNDEAIWDIKYNYNQKDRTGAEATLTDSFDTIHELVSNSFVIKKVDANGKNPVVADSSTYTISSVTKKDGKNSFTIKFNDGAVNGQAYHIQYKTKLADKDGIVANSGTLKNTVSFGEGTTKKEDDSTIGYSYNLGYKNGVIDYVNKKINWTIVVNPSNLELKNVVVTDTYPTDRSLTAPTEFKIQEENGTASVLDASKINKNILGEFSLKLGDITKKQTITYSTPYDVDSVGEGDIKNEVNYTYTTSNKTTTQSTSFEKSVKIDAQQSTKNGYKSGSYDYANRVFNWQAGFNYKRQEIKSGVFEDTLGANQELIAGSVKLYQVILSNDNVNGSEQEITDMSTIGTFTEKADKTGFTFKFKDDVSNIEAYKFKYQSKDKDEQMEAVAYTNNAKLTVENSEKYNQNASVTVNNATHTIEKGQPKIDGYNQILKWSMIINKGQSTLSNATITDMPGSNQMILPETFKIYELSTTNGTDFENNKKLVLDSKELTSTPDANGNYVYTKDGITVKQNVIGIDAATSKGFIVKFPEKITKAYKIEYDAYYNDATGTNTTNTATLAYNENKASTAGQDEKGNANQYNIAYSDSNAGATRSKVDLKIHKVDPMDNNKALAGAVFMLYNGKGNVPLATGTTDANGDIVFPGYFEGTYQLQELTAPEGFVTTGSTYAQKTQFKLLKDADTIVVTGGNSIITKTVANYKIGACVEKTITVKENGAAVNEAIITIKDKDGKVVTLKDADDKNPVAQTTVKTDGKGQVKIPLQYAVAGYTFTVVKDGVTKEYSFADLVGDCAVEVDLKTSACKETTITVKNDNTVVEHAQVQIIDNDTKEAVKIDGTTTSVTTNVDGKVIVPGKYIDKTKYTIELTLNGITKAITEYASLDCNVIIDFKATACTTTTVTVKDGDNVVEGAQVKIIDNDTKQAVEIDGTTTSVTTKAEGKVTVPWKYIDKTKYTIEVTIHGITKAITEYANSDSMTCEVVVNVDTAKCTNNILTVKTDNIDVADGTEVTVEFSNTKTENYTIKDGKITIPASEVIYGIVKVSIPDYVQQEVTITNCQGIVEFSSTACIETTLTVNDNNQVVSGAIVKVMNKTTGTAEEINGQTTLTTDSNGQVKISGQYVDSNNYTIHLTIQGVTKEISNYTVKDCALTIDFTTTASVCVQTTLTVSNNNQVASGATVKVVNKTTGAVEEINGQTTLTTNTNGQVVIPNKYADNTKYYFQLTVDGVTRNLVTFTVGDCEIVIDFAKACPDFTVNYQGPANSTAEFKLEKKDGTIIEDHITVSTDASGKGTLNFTQDAAKALQAGDYRLVQTKQPSGYYSASAKEFTVNAGECAAELTVINNKIPPESCKKPVISVTPITGEKPEAGTKVTVTTEDGKASEGTVDSKGTVTFEEGKELTLVPGKTVKVKVKGFKEQTTKLNEINCDNTVYITPITACEKVPTITIDPSVQPAPGTEVTVTPENGEPTTGKVSEDGTTVEFEPGEEPKLTPEETVTITIEGYDPVTEVVPEDCKEITITPEPTNPACEKVPTITIDPSVQLTPETEVTVTPENGEPTTGKVSEDGTTIDFEPGKEPTLEPGKKVTVKVDGYEETMVTVDEDCTPVITITPEQKACAEFAVIVKDQNGEPLAGALVKADGTTISGTTNSDGKIILTNKDFAIAQDSVLLVSKDGYAPVQVKLSDYDQAQCQAIVQLQAAVQACPEFTVNVTGKNDPIIGATVTVKGDETVTGTVNEQGDVVYNGNKPQFTPGTMIEITKDGFEKQTIVISDSTATCEIDITLTELPKACPQFTVTVNDETGAVAGANVLVKGTNAVGVTAADGTITFMNNDITENSIVVVTKEGYATKEVMANELCEVDVTITSSTTTPPVEEPGETPETSVTPPTTPPVTPPVIVPPTPENPTDPGTDPENPTDPGTDPENPTDPGTNPENPTTPPNNNNDDDDDGVEEEPNDSNTPDDEPGIDDENNNDNGNNTNGNQNGSNGADGNNSNNQNNNNNAGNNGNNTPGNGSNNNTNTNGSNGNKAPSTGSSLLPQTGEQVALYSLVGMLLIGAAFMLFKRNRRKV